MITRLSQTITKLSQIVPTTSKSSAFIFSPLRTFSLKSHQSARYEGRRIGEQLKKAFNDKIEAKKATRPDTVELRPYGDLLKAAGFFLATGYITFSAASIYETEHAKDQIRSLLERTVAEFTQMYQGATAHRERDKSTNKIVSLIIASNVAVFVLWRFPILRNQLYRYFTNSMASKSLVLPMTLSMFSHASAIHLAANMYVMNSFAEGTVGFLGPAQFLAFYLTGGVFASLASLVFKRITLSALPSLGASGAICAMLGYMLTMEPNMRISIIFLPQWHFSAHDGLIGIVAFETVMLLLPFIFPRMGLFDNACHLGGLAFGIFYAQNGEEYYRRHFKPRMAAWWIALREEFGSRGGREIGPFGGMDKETPAVVFDGKKHSHTTMSKLMGDLDEKRRAEEKEEQTRMEERRKDRERRHKEWEEHIRQQKEEQRERKRRNMEERQMRRREQETEPSKENEDGEWK